MSFQKSVLNDLAIAYEGDRIGAPFYPDKVYLNGETNGVKIGTFVWQVLNTENQVVQAKGSNNILAGIVVRNNSNINATQGISTNASLVVAYKQAVEVAQNGQFAVKLVTLLGSTPILQGAPVYISNTDGTVCADAGGSLTGYTKTNFIFDSVASELTAGQLVKISNNNKVLGA